MKSLTPYQQNKRLRDIRDELMAEFFIHGIDFVLEERKYDKKIIYFITTSINNNTDLKGFFGFSESSTGKEPEFFILDWGRVHWAKHEGFNEKDMYEKVGIYNQVKSKKDFVFFLSKKKRYEIVQYGVSTLVK